MTTYTNSHMQAAAGDPPRWWSKVLSILIGVNLMGIGAQFVGLRQLQADAAETRAAKNAVDADAQRVREILRSSSICNRSHQLETGNADSVSSL